MGDKKNPENTIANVANECPIEYGQVEEFQISSRPYGKSTRRVMRPRHIQMMAISGAIGTGLFIGSGAALARAGPGGLFLGYSIYAILTWSTFNAMGEMVSWLPVDGAFVVYAHSYLDEAWAFAIGVVYTVNNALIVASEISAVCSLIGYWDQSINNGVWVAIITSSMLALNAFGARIYGEGEFYFSIFKVLLILGLIVMTFILMVGGNPSHWAFGFTFWDKPGSFAEYIVSGSTGRFLGFWSVFVQAAFAFGGPDFVALTAGEAQNPRRVMPRVFSRVIYRLVIFYVLGVLCVGILVPYDDPALTSGAKGAGSSPFVIGVTRLGITGLPSLINAILITSAWSCGIEIFYAASRSAYAMAIGGYAPSFLLTTWRGVPIYCVVAVWLVSLISFMTASNGALTVFTWITSIVGAGNLVIYFVFHITYIRFRRAQMTQGITDSQRPWFRRHQYYYSYASAFLYGLIVLTNGFEVFIHGEWSISDFIFAYFALALFVVAFAGFKIVRRPKMAPLAQVNLMAGRSPEDWEDETTEPEPNTRAGRFNRWLWG
ncbi:AAT family amino acid transporter, partial [Aureobasidium melanogenum]